MEIINYIKRILYLIPITLDNSQEHHPKIRKICNETEERGEQEYESRLMKITKDEAYREATNSKRVVEGDEAGGG